MTTALVLFLPQPGFLRCSAAFVVNRALLHVQHAMLRHFGAGQWPKQNLKKKVDKAGAEGRLFSTNFAVRDVG